MKLNLQLFGELDQNALNSEYEAVVKEEVKNAEKEEEKNVEELNLATAQAAEEMLKEKDYIYASGVERFETEHRRLGVEAQSIVQEYRNKKEMIERNGNYTAQGKYDQIDKLSNQYRERLEVMPEKQEEHYNNHYKTRKEKTEKLYEEITKTASINDFDTKDMLYITFILQNLDDGSVVDLLKTYKFNPFLISMINAKLKKEHKPGTGKRLRKVEHPLKRNVDTNFIPAQLGQVRMPNSDNPKSHMWTNTVANLIPRPSRYFN